MTRFAIGTLITCFVLALGCSTGAGDRASSDAGGSPRPALAGGEFSAEINGAMIHYEVHGHGPVVMVVPNSWGLNIRGLRGLFEPLEQRLTLVYFDPRGMGLSAPATDDAEMSMATIRKDFDALRRHLGVEKVSALGWSNGAGNLLLLAAEYPESLEKIVVLHGIAHFGPEEMQAVGQRFPQLWQDFAALQQELVAAEIPVEEKTARMKAFWIERYFPTMTASPEQSLEKIARIFEPAEFSWRHAQYANQDAQGFDARELLPGIRAEALVISGAHDMTPMSMGEEIAAAIPDARFEAFENSGHFAPLEEPERFQKVVWEFLGPDA